MCELRRRRIIKNNNIYVFYIYLSHISLLFAYFIRSQISSQVFALLRTDILNKTELFALFANGCERIANKQN